MNMDPSSGGESHQTFSYFNQGVHGQVEGVLPQGSSIDGYWTDPQAAAMLWSQGHPG